MISPMGIFSFLFGIKGIAVLSRPPELRFDDSDSFFVVTCSDYCVACSCSPKWCEQEQGGCVVVDAIKSDF